MGRPSLTRQQYRILADYIETGSGPATAERMGLTLPTVKNTLQNARKRAGVTRTAQLAYLLGAGEIDFVDDDDDL